MIQLRDKTIIKLIFQIALIEVVFPIYWEKNNVVPAHNKESYTLPRLFPIHSFSTP